MLAVISTTQGAMSLVHSDIRWDGHRQKDGLEAGYNEAHPLQPLGFANLGEKSHNQQPNCKGDVRGSLTDGVKRHSDPCQANLGYCQ